MGVRDEDAPTNMMGLGGGAGMDPGVMEEARGEGRMGNEGMGSTK